MYANSENLLVGTKPGSYLQHVNMRSIYDFQLFVYYNLYIINLLKKFNLNVYEVFL